MLWGKGRVQKLLSSEPVPEFNVDSGINAQTIENIEITPAEVHRKLASLKVDKSQAQMECIPEFLSQSFTRNG